ncbi:MAG: NUDIX hydrolase [Candidatus Omnitrophica bacterium]|nr:NUDIX hydrolase [Candidatus Omnitrophota bacterium]
MVKYKNPIPTVDVVILLAGGKGVVLVKRKNPPYGLALPGGFVNEGESLEHAAIREAKEETGLNIELYKQFHTYSDPGRDPRGHHISTVFLAVAYGNPVAGDDADKIVVVPKWEIPADMAFDHVKILRDVKKFYVGGKYPEPFK